MRFIEQFFVNFCVRYLVLELCVATVRDYIKQDYTGSMPLELCALIQMTEGLAYIHDMKFVHRDIKPGNVLISVSPSLLLKISDFGFCRPVTESGSFSGKSGSRGTPIYHAPEFLQLDDIESQEEKLKIRFDVSIDVFSLGCLFFSYITKGDHLFAEPGMKDEKSIQAQIIKGEKILLKSKLIFFSIKRYSSNDISFFSNIRNRPLRVRDN